MCRFQRLFCIENSSSTGLGDVIGIQTSCMSLCWTSGVLFFHGAHVVLSCEKKGGGLSETGPREAFLYVDWRSPCGHFYLFLIFMRYKGLEEYELITGYIDTGLLDCFVASTSHMCAFSRLGALWKFKEDDSNEVYITDQVDR